jgi:hypothetical protein
MKGIPSALLEIAAEENRVGHTGRVCPASNTRGHARQLEAADEPREQDDACLNFREHRPQLAFLHCERQKDEILLPS